MNPVTQIPPVVDWGALAPFLWLCAGGLAAILLAVGSKLLRALAGPVAIFAVVLAGRSVQLLWSSPRIAMNGLVATDRFGLAFDLLFLTTALIAILLSMADLRRKGVEFGEFYALMLFATAGMTMMAGSTSLLGIFLGLEILSLPLYIMSGFTRYRERSLEASMKYFLMGAFSTGFTLYGMALLYGATRTLDLREMAAAVATGGVTSHGLLLAGFSLTLIGFLFKVAAFPFHFWLPDVYQGAPTTVTGYMVAGTKAAGFAAILRILTTVFWTDASGAHWTGLLSLVAILTMTAGNVVALAQNNVKRILAYSSIAHAGYIMVAVVCRTDDGVSSILFYLAAYLFMNLGAFAVVHLVEHTREGDEVGELLQAYAGMGKREPIYAAAMTIFMLALTGMPLTGGFVGKFFIFRAAMHSDHLMLALFLGLNSVVSAAYYLRVVLYMYF
ncbi:MAG TPA: NADH-quinone oxidoreductase subunit N, partial [Candidatus Saccharimonadales bacterium]|nr:NADH-quinone oxidoreductase subunit N [Candidatus Saccharimonadales bacterium]